MTDTIPYPENQHEIGGFLLNEQIPSSEEVWLRVLCAAIPTNDLRTSIEMAKWAVSEFEATFKP